jgi:hypothetical protein
LAAPVDEKVKDMCTGYRIEIARRLVRKDYGRLLDEGPRNCHALLLAAGEFVRVTVFLSFEPHRRKYFLSSNRVRSPGKFKG